MHSANSDDELKRPVNEAIRQEVPGIDLNPSTSWRWFTRGLAGQNGKRIRLQVWYVGRVPTTTRAAVRTFLDAVTEARLSKMAATQAKHDDDTESRLVAHGLTGGAK